MAQVDAAESLTEDLAPARGTARRDRWLGTRVVRGDARRVVRDNGQRLVAAAGAARVPAIAGHRRQNLHASSPTTGYQGHTLLHHFLISLMRFGIAFAICVAIGVPVGLLMGMHSGVRAVLDPPIETTRPIPKLALLPLFIIWFGIGELSKTIVIIAALFPLISISAMQAVRAVSVRKIQAAQSLGASRSMIFRRVLLPASLPGIFTGLRVSVGIGVTMLVGAEMVATSDGIAWMALTAADFVQTDIVLVGVLIMAALGYGLDQIFRLLERRVVHWAGRD